MRDIEFYLTAILSFVAGIAVVTLVLVETEYTFDHGMIKLASGEYKCELIEQQDKTTEWECESAEE